MRELINIVTTLFEKAENNPTKDELSALKSIIAAKIKQLPDDEITAKTLREIEDLLSHLSSGTSGAGKAGIINSKLMQINDPTVSAAQKMLARYILSLGMSIDDRDELFDLWRLDKLVNRKKLITPGKYTLSDIINKYDENPGIKELVDDLMQVAALGQGKGEFAFSVLSKKISKPEKGDLIIDNHKVEVKTTDGGAGRFTDQEVVPGEGFENAARALNSFVSKNPEIDFVLPKTGLSLSAACDIATELSPPARKEFLKQCKDLIKIIFNKTIESARLDKIINAISTGNYNVAIQEYSQANFNYYMGMKDDEGVLNIDLTTKPVSLTFFRNSDDLTKFGLRLHAGAPYITGISDRRSVYPQIKIVTTSFGANAQAALEKKNAAQLKKDASAQKKLDKQITKAAGQTPSTGIRPKAAQMARAKRIDAAPVPTRQKR